MCSRVAVLEVTTVHYDTGKSRIGKGWRYRAPEGAVWVSLDLRITRLTGAPALNTGQFAPTMTDRDGEMAMASGSYDRKPIPGYGTVSFRADYALSPDRAALERLVVCNAFLSSPSASKGCSLLTT